MHRLFVLIVIIIKFQTLICAANYSLDFDGSNDKVDMASNLDLDAYSTVSFQAWIKPDNASATKTVFQQMKTSGSPPPTWMLQFSSNPNITFGLDTEDVVYDELIINITASDYTDGWHHIICTYDGTTKTMYRDATSIGSDTDSGGDVQEESSSSIFRIGGRIDDTEYYDGKIDEIAIWSSCLTASEITALYNSGVGLVPTSNSGNYSSSSNLQAYYNFNDGSGTTLTDNSSNSNNGSISGAAWSVDVPHAVSIAGNSGFRMMSSPVSGAIYSDLLAELWTQGMTGGDVTDGTANVWTLNLGGQSWSALTNLSSNSLTAGQGFLVYVFQDTDWDGDSDLPVTLKVSGNANTGNVSIGSITQNYYYLAGNPYASTIDGDDITKTNLSNTIQVWDDANSDWKTWNGSSGDLSNGLIAPYQGFWVQASGGTGSFTIQEADISSSNGTFYRQVEDYDSTGSIVFNATSVDYTTSAYFSFTQNGVVELDLSDAEKLLPIQATPRLCMMSIVGDKAIKINNLPYTFDGVLTVPLDLMLLSLDETNYITEAGEVTLTWNIDEFPGHISMTLVDNITGSEVYIDYENEYIFTTEPKGSFSANYDGPVGNYPVVGEPRFTLNITYEALNSNSQPTLPGNFTLHPVYPNPFNPSATISFDIPQVGGVELNVYDVKGALVEKLISKTIKPGSHRYTWEPQLLPSGIYFMKLTTPNQTFTQKVTYIK